MKTRDLSRRSSLFFLLSSPGWAEDRAQCSCEDLLARCAARYQSETAINCQITVRISDSPDTGAQTRYVVDLKAIRNVSYYARKRISRPLRSDIAIFQHESTLTGLDFRARRYLQFPYDPAITEATELKELHFRHYGRFALLDRLDVSSRELGGDGKLCRVELVSRKEDWTGRLWVDCKNLHVVRSVFQQV